MEGYLTIRELAERWNLSVRRVQTMCFNGDIPGAIRFGNVWAIPDTVERPCDGRIKTGKYKDWKRQNETTNNQI
jgi:hypothetical protein